MPDEITMKVAEARPQDARRNLARLDPEMAERLDLHTGDAVAIEGTRRTVATVYRGYPQDAGTGLIRIDGATRRNAGVSIDDKVTVSRIEAQDAKRIQFAATQNLRAHGLSRVLSNQLAGMAVTQGDAVNLDIMGHQISLKVVDHQPRAEAVRIAPTTQIELSEKPVSELEDLEAQIPRVTYEDIGGLSGQIRKVREMIEVPLRHPEIFERVGVEPPKGVLLHGPPGTGKTLLAKAVANETQASFYHIGGPEIMSKFYGESEERLREVFEEAGQNQPAIIFIDEIDSIAPRREEATGEVERRVVSQLLTLMDGMEERGRVVVIAATNRVDGVDPALRRPGRFDRELEIGVPDQDGRKEVLQIHTRGMPLAEDVDLDSYAQRTHGYVGADLAALTREAAMGAIQRLYPKLDLETDEIPAEVLDELEVTTHDLEAAFTELTPSAMREVAIEKPDTRWEDVGGLGDARQELIEAVQWPLTYSRLYDHMAAQVPRGVLLHGPPGTGKTLLAKALAREAGVNFISVKGPELLSKWVGESEKGVREVFRKARQNAPCVIFFDEIETMASQRGRSTGDSGVTERVVSQFLTELDGLEQLKGVVVIGATNRIDLIDEALTRPGRFDRIVEVALPDEDARREILEIHMRDLPLDDGIDLEAYVKRADGWSGADLAALAHEASLLAIREHVAQGIEPDDEDAIEATTVTSDHVQAAFEKVEQRREKGPKRLSSMEIS